MAGICGPSVAPLTGPAVLRQAKTPALNPKSSVLPTPFESLQEPSYMSNLDDSSKTCFIPMDTRVDPDLVRCSGCQSAGPKSTNGAQYIGAVQPLPGKYRTWSRAFCRASL